MKLHGKGNKRVDDSLLLSSEPDATDITLIPQTDSTENMMLPQLDSASANQPDLNITVNKKEVVDSMLSSPPTLQDPTLQKLVLNTGSAEEPSSDVDESKRRRPRIKNTQSVETTAKSYMLPTFIPGTLPDLTVLPGMSSMAAGFPQMQSIPQLPNANMNPNNNFGSDDWLKDAKNLPAPMLTYMFRPSLSIPAHPSSNESDNMVGFPPNGATIYNSGMDESGMNRMFSAYLANNSMMGMPNGASPITDLNGNQQIGLPGGKYPLDHVPYTQNLGGNFPLMK